MLGLRSSEVYNFIFNITEQNNKIKLYKFPNEKSGVFHMKKSEMGLKRTWMFRIIQLMIYKMKY